MDTSILNEETTVQRCQNILTFVAGVLYREDFERMLLEDVKLQIDPFNGHPTKCEVILLMNRLRYGRDKETQD